MRIFLNFLVMFGCSLLSYLWGFKDGGKSAAVHLGGLTQRLLLKIGKALTEKHPEITQSEFLRVAISSGAEMLAEGPQN